MRPDRTTILVSGATGQQGGAVARHLLLRGFRVRALTRRANQDSARALAAQGAEIIEGEFEDPASLARGLDGADAAFSVQTFRAGLDAEVRGGKAFADAAKIAGVKHFVYSSVGGADRGTGIPHFESKWQIEQHVREIGLPATILRPVFFMENWNFGRQAILSGQLLQPLSPHTQLQQIATDDIGRIAAIAFSAPEHWIGRAVEIAGDELSMLQVAATFSAVLGRDVEYVQVPWAAFAAQAGEESTKMFQWFEAGGLQRTSPRFATKFRN